MTVMGVFITAPVLWLAAAGILAVIEAFTLGLTSIWFAGGAVCAAIAAMLGASPVIQILVFLAVTVVLLAVTRPLAKKRLNARVEKTNIEGIIGTEGIVLETIPEHGSGQVRADGKIWTAVSAGGEIAPKSIVTVKEVRGVTLTVEEKKQEG